MSEQAPLPSMTILPKDILRDIFDRVGDIGRTVFSHVNKDFAELVCGQAVAPKYLCYDAAFDNQFEVLKWAESAGYPMYALPSAPAGTGNLEMLKWIHRFEDDWDTGLIRTTYMVAASHGHWDIVKWLYAEGYAAIGDIHKEAARQGHQSIVEWLISIGYEIDNGLFTCAAEGGHFGLPNGSIKWPTNLVHGMQLQLQKWPDMEIFQYSSGCTIMTAVLISRPTGWLLAPDTLRPLNGCVL